MAKFEIASLMQKKLELVAHVPDQLEYISQEILSAINRMEIP